MGSEMCIRDRYLIVNDTDSNKFTRYSIGNSRRRTSIRIFWVKRIRALFAQRPTVDALTTRGPSARATPVAAPVATVLALHTLLFPWHHSNFRARTTNYNTNNNRVVARMASLCPRATKERISRRFYHVFARRLGSTPRQRARMKERPLSILNRAASPALVDQPIRCRRTSRQDHGIPIQINKRGQQDNNNKATTKERNNNNKHDTRKTYSRAAAKQRPCFNNQEEH